MRGRNRKLNLAFLANQARSMDPAKLQGIQNRDEDFAVQYRNAIEAAVRRALGTITLTTLVTGEI